MRPQRVCLPPLSRLSPGCPATPTDGRDVVPPSRGVRASMRSYLEACTVPTVSVGGVQLPRLIMGIHPFDGYGYVSADRDAAMLAHFSVFDRLVEVLRFGVDNGLTVAQADHMSVHLNRRHLSALWQVQQLTGVEPGLVPFLVVPLRLDGQPIQPRRVHATLDRNNYLAVGESYRRHLADDPIVGYLASGHGVEDEALVRFEDVPPYTPDELARLEVDYAALEREVGFFAGYPGLVADPGAEVDLLAPAGRFDLIEGYIAFLRRHFRAVVASVHHPGMTLPLLERQGVSFDGYITPLNRLGVFMLPTPESALRAVRASTRPVIAIKPMAGGRLLGREAFDYVLNEVGVAASMFGMGTLDEVRFTVTEAKRALGL